MNFYPTEVKTFLTKLKGLIKKISRSSISQIQSHTLTCHHLIVQMIKDDEILSGLNAQKLRLLAYEAILYLIEVLDLRSDSNKQIQKNDESTKITTYLGDINSTLIEVKELLRRCEKDSMNNGRKGLLPSHEMILKLDKNLNQYSSKLGVILTQMQRSKNAPLQSQASLTSLSNLRQAEKESDSDSVIEQMQRIIDKKQRKIIELTNLLKQSQSEKVQVEIEFKKYQNDYRQKNEDLERKLNEINRRNKELQISLKEKTAALLKDVKSRPMLKMSKNLYNQKIVCDQSKNRYSIQMRKQAEGVSQQTIPSACTFYSRQPPRRKASLDKVGSVKSFMRIGNSIQKESGFMNERKIKQMAERSQELYLMMVCQAATIQEMI